MPAATPTSGRRDSVKAIIYETYGAPDVLHLQEIDKPVVRDDDVLVNVRASSVNPYDWHFMRGKPYFMRLISGLLKPKFNRLGVDLAGQVEAVGKNVTQFRPGDAVFGKGEGAFAEYLCVPENALALKPANLTFEQMGTVYMAAVTALQGLRDVGQIQPDQKVLINGAAGGVGTFAVQIAKSYGAEVTGVCSTRNKDMVRSIGADHVIDYTNENFTEGACLYDLLFDNVGTHSMSAYRRVLASTGKIVLVGGPEGGPILGPVPYMLKILLVSQFLSQKAAIQNETLDQTDLLLLKDLLESGKVTPVIDRQYKLGEIPEAIRYLEEGHAQGKVVITL